jgi:hypothetical protein
LANKSRFQQRLLVEAHGLLGNIPSSSRFCSVVAGRRPSSGGTPARSEATQALCTASSIADETPSQARLVEKSFPLLHCLAHFVEVLMTVVDGGNSADLTADR